MGFHFKIKKPNLKNLFKTVLYSAAFGPGAGEMMAASPDIDSGMTTIGKGFGNLLTGGYVGQREALKQQDKAADYAKEQYAAETKAAQDAADKIAKEEEERKRRLMMLGQQTPATIGTGGYLGLPGSPSTSRGFLG